MPGRDRTTAASLALMALVLSGCQPITYDHDAAVTAPAPASVRGVQVPEPRPQREPFTTYYKVSGPGGVVGYFVRYDEVPAGVQVGERSAPVGATFVEDDEFQRLGFITSTGRAYAFRGAESDEIGQGSLDQVLPLYFGASGLTWAPIVD